MKKIPACRLPTGRQAAGRFVKLCDFFVLLCVTAIPQKPQRKSQKTQSDALILLALSQVHTVLKKLDEGWKCGVLSEAEMWCDVLSLAEVSLPAQSLSK